VDVALVLLIIFMAAAPTLQRTYDVTVPPKAPPGHSTSDEDQIVVSQNKRDTVWLNQEEIEIAALPGRMQGILAHRLSKQIFYAGDSTLNYQTALMTIDLLNRSGAAVGIVTR